MYRKKIHWKTKTPQTKKNKQTLIILRRPALHIKSRSQYCMHKTNHNKNIFLFATIWVSVSEMLTHPNKFICSKVNSMYTGLQADTHSGTPSRQSYLFFTSQEKKKVQRKHASRNDKITLSSAKLQGRINDASWPGNTGNVQILPAAGFVWLFCHFFFLFF